MSRIQRILEKLSASTEAAKYQQTRKGKRPIRVHNLLKKASIPGQDMRNSASVPGQSKPPTSDSVAPAAKRLAQSSAEVGPMPHKVASVDPVLQRDPLIRYLQKQAEELAINAPLEDLSSSNLKLPSCHHAGKPDLLADNKDAEPRASKDVAQTELTMGDPEPTPDMIFDGQSNWSLYLGRLFDQPLTKDKFYRKDHTTSESTSALDKVIKR